MMISLDRHKRLVLFLVRAALGYDAIEQAAMRGSNGPDWDRVQRIVKYNGVAPMVHDLFAKRPEIELPGGFRKGMQQEHMSNLVNGLLMEKVLLEVADHFIEIDLPFIVHKGLVLAALVYPAANLRPCGTDLDVFVRRSDYARATEALRRIGYELDKPGFEQYQASYIGEVHFSRTIGGRKVVVDLHVDFNPNHWGKVSGFDMGGVWDNPVQVPFQGRLIPHLPVESCLFFLAIHCAANHIFDRLILFCDIDLLIRKFDDRIDWRRVGDFAKTHGCRRALYHCLSYCRFLLGTPIPGSFLDDIYPGRLSVALLRGMHLLLKEDKPPKWLERYLHLVLLDNPFLSVKSISLFAKRIISRFSIQRQISASAFRSGACPRARRRKD